MINLLGLFSFSCSDNEVFTWGKSSRGRLGRSDEDSNLPRPVALPRDEPFTVTSLHSSHGSTLISTKRKCKLISILYMFQ